MMLRGDALLLLRNVAIALSHASAHALPLSPTESARLSRDVTDALREIAPQLRALDEIVADAQEDDALRRLVAIAPASNVIPVKFGDRRP